MSLTNKLQAKAGTMKDNLDIAVIIPCYNEAVAITKVIQDYQQALPQAKIYVYDNNSSDDTIAVAKAAGAIVGSEMLPGKGNVVRRMFADIDADIYVLVDGDDTYDPAAASKMIEKLQQEQLDMVVGSRQTKEQEAYRKGHRLGNQGFNKLVSFLFGDKFDDIFSGYRVFSKRFVKTFPAEAKGFEIETELAVHSLENRLPCAEIATQYQSRPEGSFSKLNKYRDGTKILWTVIRLLKAVRPLFFFTCIFAALLILAALLFMPIFYEYIHTGLVARFPTAFLCMGLVLLAFLNLYTGLILSNICKNRRAQFRMAYLSFKK